MTCCLFTIDIHWQTHKMDNFWALNIDSIDTKTNSLLIEILNKARPSALQVDDHYFKEENNRL